LVLARLNLLIHHCYVLQTFLAVLTLSSLPKAEIKKKWKNARRKISKEKNSIHNLQVEVKEKKVLEERNDINCLCTVEAQCNKCELPSNHFLYCILLLFYFICTLATQFHTSLHKFIDLHYRTIPLININIMPATLITLTQKH